MDEDENSPLIPKTAPAVGSTHWSESARTSASIPAPVRYGGSPPSLQSAAGLMDCGTGTGTSVLSTRSAGQLERQAYGPGGGRSLSLGQATSIPLSPRPTKMPMPPYGVDARAQRGAIESAASAILASHDKLGQSPPSSSYTDDLSDCSRNGMTNVHQKWMLASVLAVSMMLVGVVFGMALGLTPLTALYATIQVVTTIGYGDIHIYLGDSAKVGFALYILVWFILLSYMFSIILQSGLQKQWQMLSNRLRKTNAPEEDGQPSQILDELIMASLFLASCVAFGTIFYGTYEACSCSYGTTRIPGCNDGLGDAASASWIGALRGGFPDRAKCVATGGRTLSWSSAFYMAVVTLTTIGFGDHTPVSYVGRAVGCVWMLLGVVAMVNWMIALANYFAEADSEKAVAARSKQANLALFLDVDKDQMGSLSRAEYSLYVLVKHGLVSQDCLDSIDRHFDEVLDLVPLEAKESEALSFEDICRSQSRSYANTQTW